MPLIKPKNMFNDIQNVKKWQYSIQYSICMKLCMCCAVYLGRCTLRFPQAPSRRSTWECCVPSPPQTTCGWPLCLLVWIPPPPLMLQPPPLLTTTRPSCTILCLYPGTLQFPENESKLMVERPALPCWHFMTFLFVKSLEWRSPCVCRGYGRSSTPCLPGEPFLLCTPLASTCTCLEPATLQS